MEIRNSKKHEQQKSRSPSGQATETLLQGCKIVNVFFLTFKF
jgi:hypothetical protein